MLATDLEISTLTLDEILSDHYFATRSLVEDETRSDRRMKRWCEISADGDWEIFRKRLLRDGLLFEEVRARLGNVDRQPAHSEPDWVADCRNVLRILNKDAGHEVAETSGYAFGPLLAPLVATAIAELGEQSAFTDEQLVSPAARADMVRQLWQRLVELCELPLFRSLTEWRKTKPAAEHEPEFGEFIGFMRAEGFDRLFASYPQLLRLLTLVRRQWVDCYAEFIHRLGSDRIELAALEPSITASSVLTGVRFGLSDPHEGGRSVLIAVFGSGNRIVYKPKDLSSNRVIREFLDLIRERGFGLPLRVPKCLARIGYGWEEFIAAGECREASEVDEYFGSAGAWLAFLYLLGATDMHMENILAVGADPIPVDFETIFQGLTQKLKSITAELEAAWLVNSCLERSVLTVGLLPCHVRTDDQTTISVGGLEPSSIRRKRIAWREMNSVRMQPRIVEETHTISSNLPRLAGEAVLVAGHREALVEGFRTALDFARNIRSELISFVETAGKDLLVRRVFRPTRFYDLLLRRLSDHRAMSDSVTWSMQTEFIARFSDWDNEAEDIWKLFSQERRALTQLTIPAFHVAADQTVVRAGHREIADLHIEPGVQTALGRIKALSDRTISEQTRMAEASLGMQHGRNIRASAGIRTSALDLPLAIHAHLCERAFMGGSAAAWLGLEYLDERLSAQLIPVGYDLYNGSCGIAVFFAALARTRQLREAADMARASIAQVKSAVRSANRQRILRSMGPGGGVGVGSIIYGLTTVAELLDDGDTLDAAVTTASLLTDEVINKDDCFDIIGGVAGTCLALLKLHRVTGNTGILAQAVRCADHLEASRPADGKIWSSSEFEHHPLTGISHGAAGYGLAFARLFAATSIERYRHVARSCVEFEDAHYNSARRNWPDLRPGRDWWPVQWCYGAPGIVYARIAMADDGALKPDSVQRDVRNAAEAALAATPYSNDTLCCGVAGQADFLLEASRYLHDPALEQAGARRVAEICQRWSDAGDARWDIGTREYNLGLFRGVAGLGYAALRVENPHLPKLLVWN